LPATTAAHSTSICQTERFRQPGAIETDFGGGTVRDNAEVNKMVAGNTALGRVGLPDDIGAAIALLLAPGGQWINGQRVEASGGMFL
jgi:NAD(P)-dependent dehydrogenase (short-subunit alcohol dehydrogenase family)